MRHLNHGHGHNYGKPIDQGWAFLTAIILNITFVVIELIYGFIAHSMALIADAGHNLFDVFGLVLAAWAAMLMRCQPDERYTYGLRGSSILAALANAMLLLVACGAIAWEAVHRFFVPPQVAGLTVSVVAGVGIVINGVSAWLFFSGSKIDLNIRAAYLHMAADTAVSLGVVIAGIIMFYTGLYWLDPLVSIIIVAVILFGTWGLLRDSVNLALNAVPPHIDINEVRQYLVALPNVIEIHDLHIWGMSTKESALTAHLVMPKGHPGDDFVEKVTLELEERFLIHHTTIQIELGKTGHGCSLDPSA
jgi:cobalt-zinc-cadmium efflux system protein